MTASVVQAVSGTASTTLSTSPTISISTTPTAGDIAVVMLESRAVRAITAASGMGGTWGSVYTFTDASFGSTSIWVGTGVNASGTISLTVSGSANDGQLTAWLVSGLPAPTAVGSTLTGASLTASSTVSTADGEFVVGNIYDRGTVSGFSGTPSGWVAQSVAALSSGTNLQAAHYVPSASVSASFTFTSASNFRHASIVRLVPAAPSTVTVTAPLLTTITDVLDPTVDVAAPTPVTVSAPLLTTTTTMRAPLVVSGTIVSTSMSGSAGGTASIAGSLNVTPTVMRASGGGRAVMRLPRTHILDPRTGMPQYQLRVVDDTGTPIADLAPRVTMDGFSEALNEPTGFAFTLATMDPDAALVTPTLGQRVPSVQLWRGKYLAGWVDIINAVPSDDGRTTYRCKDRRWTLENAHIGKSPLRNLIINGDFSKGDRYGTYGWDAGSTPAANPLHSVVEDDFSSSGYALELTGADKSQLTVEDVKTGAVFVPNSSSYLSGGESVIEAVGANIPDDSDVHIVGHTANNSINGDYGDGMALSLARANAAKATLLAQNGTLHITTEGKGFYQPVASNATEAGQAQNRRVVISYQGVEDGTNSAQWRMVSAKITHPTAKRRPLTVTAAGEFKITAWTGPNKDNYAVRFTLAKASAPGVILKSETVSMDGAAGMDSYEGSSVSLEVPADGVEYLLRAYYYAPAGTIRWIDIGLHPDDVLGFYGVDQALIVKALIEHAQDPAMGRATLNLATNCRLTGVPRPREYLFRDRMPIATAVEEFPSLNRGVDIDLVATATTRTVTTYYPRQGESTAQVLALGHNVVRYEAPVDVTQVATSVVVQADSISTHRQEGHVSEPSRLGGMVLERIVKAEKETPYRDLQGEAVAELARFGGPFPLLSVECDPRRTSDLIDTVRKGDRVRVIISDGRTNIDGLFSVYGRDLDPNTDALTYRLAQEV